MSLPPDPGPSRTISWRQKSTPLQDSAQLLPFLHPFAEDDLSGSPTDSMTDLDGSGPTSAGGQPDSMDSGADYGLRVMSWNVQDLGGGPSRGKRSDEVIARIARIIVECDPDVCVILEVKQNRRPPVAPAEPLAPRMSRRLKTGAALKTELDRRQAEYQKAKDAWVVRNQEFEAAGDGGDTPPGIVELERIVGVMNTLAGRVQYARVVPADGVQIFTHGETYGFVCNMDLVQAATFELLNTAQDGSELHWPEPGYRTPARCTLTLKRPSLSIDIVAFHAPAPNHGEITHRAIQQFQSIRWRNDTVIAGDFNVDTEAVDDDDADEAIDTLLSFYDGGASEYRISLRAHVKGTVTAGGQEREIDEYAVLTGIFIGWILPQDDEDQSDDAVAFIDAQFDGFINAENVVGQLDLEVEGIGVIVLDPDASDTEMKAVHLRARSAKSHARRQDEQALRSAIFEMDPAGAAWSIGVESDRTSLRRKVERAKCGLLDDFDAAVGLFSCADVLNNAGYDKLVVVSNPVSPQLEPVNGWIYPLVERCLPVALRGAFNTLELSDGLVATAPFSTRSPNDPELYVNALLELHQNVCACSADAAESAPEPMDDSAVTDQPAAAGPDVEMNDKDADADDDSTFRASSTDSEASDEATEEQVELCKNAAASIRAIKRELQYVLDAANEISDHVPIILDVKLLQRS